jgi:hypothetical protein
MSADNDHQPKGARRAFTVDEARTRAREALQKSEFILSRAYGLFKDPKSEWEQIRAEETSIQNILIGYVAPLAAIPPICDLIGQSLFNSALVADPGAMLIRAVVTWLVSVGLVFFLGVLINVLADQFEAEKSDLNAQKLAAYSLTPSFLSGVFSLWPPLWWLSLFALAAMVWLMYRGMPILMRAPDETALPYAATVTIATMVAGILLFSLASCVAG